MDWVFTGQCLIWGFGGVVVHRLGLFRLATRFRSQRGSHGACWGRGGGTHRRPAGTCVAAPSVAACLGVLVLVPALFGCLPRMAGVACGPCLLAPRMQACERGVSLATLDTLLPPPLGLGTRPTAHSHRAAGDSLPPMQVFLRARGAACARLRLRHPLPSSLRTALPAHRPAGGGCSAAHAAARLSAAGCSTAWHAAAQLSATGSVGHLQQLMMRMTRNAVCLHRRCCCIVWITECEH